MQYGMQWTVIRQQHVIDIQIRGWSRCCVRHCTEQNHMIPIHELLNRIKWDAEFGHAEFIIAYYDRLDDRLIRVALKELFFDSDDHFDFELTDDTDKTHTIPLHRIREVYRNGRLIWSRGSDQ